MSRQLVVGLALLTLCYPSVAKPWRGIVPLESTRADVERLLGRPKDPIDGRYYLSDEIVFFEYAGNGCKQSPNVAGWPNRPVRWNVKPDTVVLIGIKHRNPLPLSSLFKDLSKFTRSADTHQSTIFYYEDKSEGFTIETFEEDGVELIRGYIYEPGAGHESLLCK